MDKSIHERVQPPSLSKHSKSAYVYMEKEVFFSNVCPFDCAAVVGSVMKWPLNIRFTIPVG